MYFIICILLLLFIIVIFFQKIIIVEYFENNKNVFLIGDSILQNNLYANPSIDEKFGVKNGSIFGGVCVPDGYIIKTKWD